MIKLNPNSWFIRTYLGIKNEYDLPNGVCDLLAQTFFVTLMYLIATAGVAFVVSSMIYSTLFGFNVDAMDAFTASKGSSVPAHAINAFAIMGYVFITGFLFKFFFGNMIAEKRKQREVNYNAEYVAKSNELRDEKITRSEFDLWYRDSKYNKPSWYETTTAFIGAIFTRITDKTCVMIDWQKKDR